MKWLLLLFLFLSGCASQSTDLKVGDCFITGSGGTTLLLKVTEVGKYAYASVAPDGVRHRTFSKDPTVLIKTDCFESFDKVQIK
jgi:hypothetical protein